MESLVSVLVPEEYRVRRHYSKILSDSFPLLLKQLERQRKNTKSPKPRLILVIHCIDSESLRDDKTQVQLCQLANLPEVKLICSAENIAAPLLWDSFKAENYNFVYHDITTYQPYIVETSFKDAIDIGKTKRTSSSRGAMFVLRALNENSKTIYKILLESQIERIKQLNPKSGVRSTRGTLRTAIDFKALHKNCMEHFVTSNEISFRAMLTEFLEHNMCKLTKDDAGTEKVFIAYTFEEMNKLLKESL
ncbi:origin recognition complex subunit 2, partial [Yamadazyma tenuis ATCC 10573]